MSTVHRELNVRDAEVVQDQPSFHRDFLSTTATNVAIGMANVLTGIVVARMLNPAGRGELAAILSWPTFLGVVTGLGMSEALVYFPARQRARTGRYLGTGLVLALAASIVFAAIGWLLMPILLAAQSDSVITAARWYLLQVPVAAVFALSVSPLRGIGDMRAWNRLRLLPTLVWLGTIAVFAVRSTPSEPEHLALTFVIVRAALVPVALAIVRHRLRQGIRPERSLARPLLRFGLPSAMATLPTTLNVRMDQLLIAAFLPPGDLGLYVVAVAWATLTSPVMLAFGDVLFPRVAAHGDPNAGGELAARGIRTAVIMAVLLTGILLVITPTALPLLFGPRFAVAVPTALVLTVAGGIIGVADVAQEGLRGLGRPAAVFWSQLIGFGVTAVGLALTVPGGGLAWIAIASVVGYSALSLALVVQLIRATGLPAHSFVIPRAADLAAIVEGMGRLVRRGAPS